LPRDSGESPNKRSPAKKLEHLARQFISSSDKADHSAVSSAGGSPRNHEKRRWREGFGRKLREFQRKEREDEMSAFKHTRGWMDMSRQPPGSSSGFMNF
jgi:hypothetical protein